MALGFLEALILGLVQGIAEWLPISSSGHLVLVQHAMKLEDMVLYDALLHLATAAAAVFVMRADIARLIRAFVRLAAALPGGERAKAVWRSDADARMAVWVVLGSIPVAAVGFLLSDTVEALFDDILSVSIFFIVTGIVLLSTRWAPSPEKALDGPRTAFVGLAQAAALAPGISRSGMTVSAGLHAGLDRAAAARYSILLSIPAVLGAAALQLFSAAGDGTLSASIGMPEAAGLAAAAAASFLCVRLLMDIVRKGYVHLFAAYCIGLGSALVLYIVVW